MELPFSSITFTLSYAKTFLPPAANDHVINQGQSNCVKRMNLKSGAFLYSADIPALLDQASWNRGRRPGLHPEKQNVLKLARSWVNDTCIIMVKLTSNERSIRLTILFLLQNTLDIRSTIRDIHAMTRTFIFLLRSWTIYDGNEVMQYLNSQSQLNVSHKMHILTIVESSSASSRVVHAATHSW